MVRMGWGLALLLLLSPVASATVSIVPEPRTELLYSTSKDVDCTTLHQTDPSTLPFNIVRLGAQVDGATPDPSIRLKWTIKGNALGALAADEDLGPTGMVPTVTAMCADFGNACLLSGDRLSVYDEPTIFYVAPTCDDLARDPSKPFKGGTAKITVKAFAGKKKLGKATTTLGYGRIGSTTLYVTRTPDGKFVDGIGKSAVSTDLLPIYAATVEQPPGMPKPPVTYKVSGGLGSFDMLPGCSVSSQFAACKQFLQSPGKGTMTLATTFDDDSALCDNIRIVVADCNANAKLDIIPKPKRSQYNPGSAGESLVDLTVRFRNTSKAGNGLPACGFVLTGSDILICSSTLKVGQFEDTKDASFSLPHCSQTTTQSCTNDLGCAKPACPACENAERCLTQPYCSSTTDRSCTTDTDCTPPSCPTCEANEICVHFLQFPPGPIGLAPGQSVDLISGTVALRNAFKKPAKLTDTWTVNADIPPGFSVSKTLKYRIKGQKP
ncbi:MAG: hypothetical protein ACREQL_15345 [Candidatus Binatia bacterium]